MATAGIFSSPATGTCRELCKPRTVERHKYNLMGKLQLRTTAELTGYAIQRGLIQAP